MRYVRHKTIITKVVDEQIEDPDTVRAILQVIYDKELQCSIGLNNTPIFQPVRILSLSESGLVFQVIHPYNLLRKSAQLGDIEYLEVNTTDTWLVKTKPNISRWMLLDPSTVTSDIVSMDKC